MSRAILIALLTAVMLPAVADAKKPPQGQSLFIGEVQNGKFPDHLRFGAHHVSDEVPERIMACLAIRRPVRTRPNPWFGDDYAAYGLRWAPDRQKLDFWVGFFSNPNLDGSFGNALAMACEHYRLGSGDVFPICDELYLATTYAKPVYYDVHVLGYPGLVWKQGGAPSMELDRVTEKVPQGQRPAGACRSIAMASSLSEPARLFYDSATCFQGEVEVREIQAAERDKSLPRAVVIVREPAMPGSRRRNVAAAPTGGLVGVTAEQATEFQVSVCAGDVLATKRQAYKILKIVPSGPVDLGKLGRGRLVGWIEIDPKPIPPPAKVPDIAPVSAVAPAAPRALPGLPKPGCK